MDRFVHMDSGEVCEASRWYRPGDHPAVERDERLDLDFVRSRNGDLYVLQPGDLVVTDSSGDSTSITDESFHRNFVPAGDPALPSRRFWEIDFEQLDEAEAVSATLRHARGLAVQRGEQGLADYLEARLLRDGLATRTYPRKPAPVEIPMPRPRSRKVGHDRNDSGGRSIRLAPGRRTPTSP